MKLFVGSLPFEFTDQDLEDLFKEVGAVVSAKVIRDRESGRSRGFGFVEMSSDDEGRSAIEKLDGARAGGRTIVVKEAHSKDEPARR